MRTLICILTIFLFACNPVKKVLNDPKKFEQVKEAVIRSGACVNDTVTIETKVDSIVTKDSIIERIVSVPCKDFDTTLSDGAEIKVSSGVLTYKAPKKEKQTTITKTNNIRDRSFENLLKSDIAKRDSVISYYAKYIENQNKDLKEAKKENRELKRKLILLALIALIIIFRKQVIRLIALI